MPREEQVAEAHEDPPKYPNLVAIIVRVTSFSAYFACLSRELRQLVFNRPISDSDGIRCLACQRVSRPTGRAHRCL